MGKSGLIPPPLPPATMCSIERNSPRREKVRAFLYPSPPTWGLEEGAPVPDGQTGRNGQALSHTKDAYIIIPLC